MCDFSKPVQVRLIYRGDAWVESTASGSMRAYLSRACITTQNDRRTPHTFFVRRSPSCRLVRLLTFLMMTIRVFP